MNFTSYKGKRFKNRNNVVKGTAPYSHPFWSSPFGDDMCARFFQQDPLTKEADSNERIVNFESKFLTTNFLKNLI